MSGFSGRVITSLSNSLIADVTMSTLANYFDGPSVAQGTSGTWFAGGTISARSSVAGDMISCKLWDGTTVVASASASIPAANFRVAVSLSGFFTSPAANIRISVRSPNNTAGVIMFNDSGNSKDSTITVIRIA